MYSDYDPVTEKEEIRMESIYGLTGLHCEKCAQKVTQRLKKVPHVEAVDYTFSTKKMKITMAKTVPLAELVAAIREVHEDAELTEESEEDRRDIDEIGIHEDNYVSEQTNEEQYVHVHGKTHEHTQQHEQVAPHIQGHTHEHSHSHAHGHSHASSNNPLVVFLQKHLVTRIIIAAALLVLLLVVRPSGLVAVSAYVLLYLFIGGDVLYSALTNILHGEIFDEQFLMSIATIGAFAIAEYPEAVVVMLFYQIGEYFQDKAVEKSRASIADLMDIRPDYANLLVGDKTERVRPETIAPNDLLVIKPGERIPLDGIVLQGESFVDTSALTGESVPRKVEKGDEVLSGTINNNGLLTIEVTKVFAESTVAKILDLVEHAGNKKAPTENFITKFSKYYTPVVVFAALALAFIPPLFFGVDTFFIWLERALTFLVISCPCALVISVPLGFFSGLGLASKNGILIKGGNFLEALSTLDTVVFDKTGTLTKGQFAITKLTPASGFSQQQLLTYATCGEWFSSHPIALAIKKEATQVDEQQIKNYTEIPGHGITLSIGTEDVYVGNGKLMQRYDIAFIPPSETGTVVYVAVGQKFVGSIVIADKMKTDAKATITGLQARNIKTVMLTGDNKATAAAVAGQLGIETYYAELLPQDKLSQFERLCTHKRGALMFVGDGINDAPVLAEADLGVSMGGIGSDAAIEASDIVLMSDEPSKILTSIQISQKTKQVVWQNIIFALTIKVVILILGAVGLASMWAAVFADIGVSLLAIANSMRLIYLKVEQGDKK
jgi:Cd2+/Zn2+-exporting ATPase